MIIYLNRGSPVHIRQSPLSRLRAGALALRKKFSHHSGGSALLLDNLRRELALQTDFFWSAEATGEPINGPLDAAWVISSLHDLKCAIQWKKEGRIRKLWVGPNMVIVPQEAHGLLGSSSIDACVVPCDWVAALYAREEPSLKEKLTVWPVGLDTDHWKDTFQRAKTSFLIYNKNQPDMADTIRRQLNAQGLETHLMTYGRYTPGDYRVALSQSKGMIFLSRSESQGLAALEALSMNVPLLAWDPEEMQYVSSNLGKSFSCVSTSVPYFDSSCGERFKTMTDFPNAFTRFSNALESYRPREWLLNQHLDLKSNLKRFSPLEIL